MKKNVLREYLKNRENKGKDINALTKEEKPKKRVKKGDK